MLYWKYSETRIFFLNEYWILTPLAILANYVIIGKINSGRKKKEDLKAQIEREQKIRRILLLSLGLNGCAYTYILTRGGAGDFIDLVDVDYIQDQCDIEKGLRYLDNPELRKVIQEFFSDKRKGKIIYITATALCHLANHYGEKFLVVPYVIGKLGLTNVYQFVRKTLVVILLGSVVPLVWMRSGIALSFALGLVTSGLKLAFSNLDVIPTSPVPVDVMDSAKYLPPRIKGMDDVLVVNNRDKIIMGKPVQENPECWLPDQAVFNANCKTEIRNTEIPEAIDLVSPDLKYDEVVNMQDITGLKRVEFTDKLDLGQTKPSIPNPRPRNGKTVNFLDKFGDSGTIDESETWDTDEFMVPKIKTRNEL